MDISILTIVSDTNATVGVSLMIGEETLTTVNGLDSIVKGSMSINIVTPTIVLITDAIVGVALTMGNATLSIDDIPATIGLDSYSSVGSSM